MKICSFAAIKGGVGKTTLTFNFGEWLVSNGNRVLLIDGDHQCSLSQTYDIFKAKGTIANIFLQNNENVDFIRIKENLDLISSSLELEEISEDLQTQSNKELILWMWFADNFEILSKYDYIIFDSHPDFSTITKNIVAVSDVIFSPIEPSEYGFTSKDNLNARFEELKKNLIDVRSRETFITASKYFIGNRIKHHTNSSREFIKTVKDEKDVIALIPEKELFNRSTLDRTPIFNMRNDKIIEQKNKIFFEELKKIFTILKEKIDMAGDYIG